MILAPMPRLIDRPVPVYAKETTSLSAPVHPEFAPVLPASKSGKAPSSLPQANVGIASWYGAVLDGHRTASGERFDMNKFTAAHRTLPFGTLVRVVDLNSGRSVVVRINDRGVLFPERIIDLSRAAADELGIRKSGVTRVRLEVLKKHSAGVEQAAAAEPPPPASAAR